MAPKNQHTRPTPDRVREALFSRLGDLEGASFLDLFSGTGAVALEALSRGAARAVSVEQARPALAVLKGNRDQLGADTLEIVGQDGFRYVRDAPDEGFDFVFADPPWSMAVKFLEHFSSVAAHWVNPEGLLILEQAKRQTCSPSLDGFHPPNTKAYGEAVLHFYDRV